MDIQTFLTECLMRGISIDIDGGALVVESKAKLKPATADYIRQHKPKIIEVLSAQDHGPCLQCGTDTESILTKPGAGWVWCCPSCFDLDARPLPTIQEAHDSEIVKQ